MDAIDLLLSRRSCVVKAMCEPGPSTEQLELILTAGMRVPDHGKLAPWRIQVVDRPGQAVLGDLCASVMAEAFPDLSESEIEIERQRPQRSPLLLVVTDHLAYDHKIPVVEQVLSGGALCQNLLNAAHALGYVGQWLSEWPVRDESIKSALGHDPDVEMIGWIHLGSTETPPAERWRPDHETVISHWTGVR